MEKYFQTLICVCRCLHRFFFLISEGKTDERRKSKGADFAAFGNRWLEHSLSRRCCLMLYNVSLHNTRQNRRLGRRRDEKNRRRFVKLN